MSDGGREGHGGVRVAAVLLVVAAGLWAVAGSAWVLPELSANSDEGLYLLQADAIASGHLAPVAPAADPAAHQPWFSVVRSDRYVLKYSPVHASVLAAAKATTGSTGVGLALIAGAQVLMVMVLARELGASRGASLTAGAIFATAPLVLQLDITYLPYGTSMALLLGMTAAAWRALRTGSRRMALLAGFVGGLAAFARPYDALLFGVAILGTVAVRQMGADRCGDRLTWPLVGVAALGAGAPLAALLAFNHAMTGELLQLPFHLLEPSDTPGLGLRRALPEDGYLDYTLARAMSSLGRNLLLLSVWSGGGLLGGGLGIVALARRRLEGGLLLALTLVVWPIGYSLFWGSYVAAYLWDGALFLGPFYFLPMVALLAIAAGVGLEDLWRWRRVVGGAAAVGMVALSGAVAVPRIDEQIQRSAPREAVAAALDATVESPALVFVPPLYGPYLQNPLSFLRNAADLSGPVVFALDRDPVANTRVRAAHPDRRAYRLILPNGWDDRPGFQPEARVVELSALPAP